MNEVVDEPMAEAGTAPSDVVDKLLALAASNEEEEVVRKVVRILA